jgi:hypothetical protein
MEREQRPCPCKRLKCERHGDCAACRQYHREHKKYPPYCERAGKNREKRAEVMPAPSATPEK